MKVLVTGGAGFIGSHIVELLLHEGYDTIVCDNLSSGHREYVAAGAKLYEVDIASPEMERIFQYEAPDFVVHLAAQVKRRLSIRWKG